MHGPVTNASLSNAFDQYPFPLYQRTWSQYVPIYPSGWGQPCSAAVEQILTPLLNSYVAELKGVVLGFKKVTVSARPGRRGAADSDEDPVQLLCLNEYAVGFCWVTAEIALFAPRQGAWMEGDIIIENEGYIVVICWDKFNASIEAGRLPPQWRWIPLDSAEATAYATDMTAIQWIKDDYGATRQILPTGFWVDGDGKKVKRKQRFRIQSYNVVSTGDYQLLSIQGTLLDDELEAAAARRDFERDQARKHSRAGKVIRRIPSYSMTKLGKVEVKEEGLQKGVSEHIKSEMDEN
jgi:DNA-directed RNA polymerase I subunit RPA43